MNAFAATVSTPAAPDACTAAPALTVPRLELPRLVTGRGGIAGFTRPRGRHRRDRAHANRMRQEQRLSSIGANGCDVPGVREPHGSYAAHGYSSGFGGGAGATSTTGTISARASSSSSTSTPTAASASASASAASVIPMKNAPPGPPLRLTAAVACDPATDPEILWHIARTAPELRRWLVANPRAGAELLEYVAQRGGPGVHEAITVLLELLERQRR